MTRKNKNFILKTLVVGMLTASLNLYAVDIEQNEKAITFNSLEKSHYKLTLISPNKVRHTFEVNNKNFNLTADMLNLKAFDNGLYKYELLPFISTGDLGGNVRELNNPKVTQEFIDEFSSTSQIHSGTFSIIENKLAINSEEIINKDFTILDDLIVDGSACIGFDCVDGESFGFDTIRLKENNLRIKFEDTSIAASFPGNDWQITINDSANGGVNKFSIDDITGGRTPFTIEANAPSHSLYVDDGGRLGLGTSIPSTDIHVIAGDTATLRLEQNGSSGFAPQIWDVAGNETNFFVRDVSNGSTLPFRIRPDAPTNSIYIDAGGDVGMGTASPAANLNVLSTANNTTASQPQLLVNNTNATTGARILAEFENNGPAFVDLSNSNSGQTWRMRVDGTDGFGISLTGDADDEFFLTDNGNLTISGTLTTTGTVCGTGCDLVFSDDYKLPSIEEHAAEMWGNSYLPSVGATIENAPFNITEKTGGMLNELEKAHIYIEQLNSRINKKENELNVIKSQFVSLEQRLAKLETK